MYFQLHFLFIFSIHLTYVCLCVCVSACVCLCSKCQTNVLLANCQVGHVSVMECCANDKSEDVIMLCTEIDIDRAFIEQLTMQTDNLDETETFIKLKASHLILLLGLLLVCLFDIYRCFVCEFMRMLLCVKTVNLNFSNLLFLCQLRGTYELMYCENRINHAVIIIMKYLTETMFYNIKTTFVYG